MTTKLAKTKVYLRNYPTRPVKMPDLTDWIPATVTQEQLDQVLSIVDGKDYLSGQLWDRMHQYMVTDLGLFPACAHDMIAQRLGWATFRSITNKVNPELLEKTLARHREWRETMERIQTENKERQVHKALVDGKTSDGRYGNMGLEFGKKYFFETNQEYLLYLEERIQEWTDVRLDRVISNWPERMGWEDFLKTFGEFWKHVLNHHKDHLSFVEPGLLSVKRLANYLFIWSFRRYMEVSVIRRHAKFLPVEYRTSSRAIQRHSTATPEPDIDYGIEEEPDDNIGNR